MKGGPTSDAMTTETRGGWVCIGNLADTHEGCQLRDGGEAPAGGLRARPSGGMKKKVLFSKQLG
jgi:hypothetical protein